MKRQAHCTSFFVSTLSSLFFFSSYILLFARFVFYFLFSFFFTSFQIHSRGLFILDVGLQVWMVTQLYDYTRFFLVFSRKALAAQ